jgi:hypothetical protein
VYLKSLTSLLKNVKIRYRHMKLMYGICVMCELRNNFLAMAAFPLFIGKPEQAHKTVKGVEIAMQIPQILM